jgi:Spy/CpxP family protein refolding chaperone
MRRSFFVIFMFFLFFYYPFKDSIGEGPHHSKMPMMRECLPLEELSLTEDQRSSYERINSEFFPKISRLRLEYIERRMELERLLRDSMTTEENIRKKSKELINTQNLLQEIILEYQLRLRTILTKDQLSRCCIIIGPGYETERWRRRWK